MYVSTNWLKSVLIFKNIRLIDIKEKLTLSGFEVEETKISKILNKKDVILDLSTTTNRPDILSIAGLSQEINSLLNIELKQSKITKKSFNYFNNFSKQIKNHQDNFFYTIAFILTKVTDVEIKKIQPWIQKRLLSANIIPQNNLNDLTQYCILEWGQPIFIYDLDKLKKLTKTENPKISTRFAKSGEVFIDSNFKTYLLTDETLVVTAENNVISIAGSVISKDCFVDNSTKNSLVEFSIFDPKIFRKSERSVGIRTNNSIFYERGINIFLLKASYNRFFNLLFLLNKNSFKNNGFYLFYLKQLEVVNKKIPVSFQNIIKVLGNYSYKNNQLSKNKIIHCLKKLNFKFLFEDDIFYIYPPLTRSVDLEEEIDVIEEISRFYGFNNFKSILPKPKKIGKLSKYTRIKKTIRYLLILLGFSETYNYSLISENCNKSTIMNPLNSDYSSLRENLIPQLIKTLEKNIDQGNKIFPVFEIGHIFKKDNFNSSFVEKELLCGIFGTNNYRISWSDKEFQLNWFQAKSLIEIIFNNIELEVNFSKKNVTSEFYHPKNCLSILYKNQEIGLFGAINPKLSFLTSQTKTFFLFEIELIKLFKLKTQKKTIIYNSYSLYPSLSIDLSLLIPKKISFKEIIFIIEKCATDLIEIIELFDIYENFESTNSYYSLGLKLVFRSQNKTLLKAEVDIILLEIESELKENLNVYIRN